MEAPQALLLVLLALAVGPAEDALSRRVPHLRSELASVFAPPGFKGRLTGFGFHSQVALGRPAAPPGSDLARIAQALEREIQVRPSAGARAALALVKLAAGKPRQAVSLLEAAVAATTPGQEQAGYLNDLAVAYLSRAGALDSPHDVARALDAASQAGVMDPSLAEACFNRAMALEHLQLVRQAAAAWETCAGRESEEDWRGDMERRLAGLRQAPAAPRQGAPGLGEDASGTGGAASVADSSNLKAVRDQAQERLLAEWGTAFLERREADAAALAAHGLQVGAMLARRTGDTTVLEVFDPIARWRGSPEERRRLAALARAAGLYGQARRDLASYRVEASLAGFEQARDLFARAANPMQNWAELGAAGADFYRDDFARARDRLEALAASVDETHHPALAAQWHWIRGMTYSRQGNLRASLRDFEVTAALYGRTGERESLGGAYELISETYAVLGDEDGAWRYRMRALVLLRATPASRRTVMLLRDAGESLLAEGLAHGALAFQDEAVKMAAVAGEPRDHAEMLLWRGRVLTALGRGAEAGADLESARRLAARIEDPSLRERALADIGFAEADQVGAVDPPRALALYDAPAGAYRRKGHVLPLANLLLRRSALERALNLPAREREDLAAGIELFELQWRTLDDEKDRVSFLGTAVELYDAAIRLESEQGDAAAALELSERSRAFWTGSPGSLDVGWVRSLAGSPRGLDGMSYAASSSLPPDLAFLEYALDRDRLRLWLLTSRGLRYLSSPVDAARVEGLVTGLRDSARYAAGSSERFLALAAEVYDLLLRGVADEIAPEAKLVIVPDKVLYGVPFAALFDRDTGRFLIQDHDLAVAPSASFVVAAARRPSAAPVGDDMLLISPLAADLRESRAEIADLEALYPGAAALTAGDARKERVLPALDRHRILHYAGHAEVHPTDPFLSRLPLGAAEGDALTMRELEGPPFTRLDLVVLSACGSVAAASTRTGGFLGLARPFLSRGARAVVGTLWDVDDAASRAIVVAFHRALRTGSTPAAALRAAQLRGLEQGLPPSAWAAFAVVGAGTSH